MYCHHCGQQINGTEQFCPHCGSSLKSNTTSSSNQYTSSNIQSNSNGFIALILAIVTFLIPTIGLITSIISLVIATKYKNEKYTDTARIIAIVGIIYQLLIIILMIIFFAVFAQEISRWMQLLYDYANNAANSAA